MQKKGLAERRQDPRGSPESGPKLDRTVRARIEARSRVGEFRGWDVPNERAAVIFELSADDIEPTLSELRRVGPQTTAEYVKAGDAFDLHMRHLWIDNLILGPGQEEVTLQIDLACDRASGKKKGEFVRDEFKLVVNDHLSGQQRPTSRLLAPLGHVLVRGARCGVDGVDLGFRLNGRIDDDATKVFHTIGQLLGAVDKGVLTTAASAANALMPTLNLGALATVGGSALVPLLPIIGRGFSLIGEAAEKGRDVVQTLRSTFYPAGTPGNHFRLKYARYLVVQTDRIRDEAHGGKERLDADYLSKGTAYFRAKAGELRLRVDAGGKEIRVPFNFWIYEVSRST